MPTLDRVSELWTVCPIFGQSVRTLDRVSELWTGCPNFGQCVRTLSPLPLLFLSVYCRNQTISEEEKRENFYNRQRLPLIRQKSTKTTLRRHLFPHKVADHDHQLRHPELYMVNRARTERYRQSAILHMQRLLNSNILWMIIIPHFIYFMILSQ